MCSMPYVICYGIEHTRKMKNQWHKAHQKMQKNSTEDIENTAYVIELKF
jgi:hypothetical protein